MLVTFVALVSCGSGLNISVWQGDHRAQEITRRVVVDGRKGTQKVSTSNPYFSQLQCIANSDMWKIKELYQRARRAGVQMDDL